MVPRLKTQLVIRPEDAQPLGEGLQLMGTHNPGGIDTPQGPVLLVRMTEGTRVQRDGMCCFPRFTEDGEWAYDWYGPDEMMGIDPQCMGIRSEPGLRLGSVSYLTAYRLNHDFSIAERLGTMLPRGPMETFGLEDARITEIEGKYWITYVGVSKHGVATLLASTTDFHSFERHGVIFPCENKDVVLFPERVHGRYACLHRPNPNMKFSPPEMWYATSPDLLDWGGHRVLEVGGSDWEAGRVGGGAPPMRVQDGWLEIYHGSSAPAPGENYGVYSGGALLLHPEEPWRVRAHSDGPILQPEMDWEKNGYVDHVVFPTAVFDRDDTLVVVYGGADRVVGAVTLRKSDVVPKT